MSLNPFKLPSLKDKHSTEGLNNEELKEEVEKVKESTKVEVKSKPKKKK